MSYIAQKDRYDKMIYRRSGNSGLKFPIISLGLWHNFGKNANHEECKDILTEAFDNGITHFDLANNYGGVFGSAEERFGEIYTELFKPYRDELLISTKAGYEMWDGPYGDFGSRKYLIASLDQSLKRMKLDYVDIFYHHRPDFSTDLEETAVALDDIVRSGKALYIGISNYFETEAKKIIELFKKMKTPFVINQCVYNMFQRGIENKLLKVMEKAKRGIIAYSPLAQGLLTDRYLNGIPSDARVNKSHFLTKEDVDKNLRKIISLNDIAKKRGQTLAQMSLSWDLRNETITSVIVGVSKKEQLYDNLKAISKLDFGKDELISIDRILKA